MKFLFKGSLIQLTQSGVISSPIVEAEFTGSALIGGVPTAIGVKKFLPGFGGGYVAEWIEAGQKKSMLYMEAKAGSMMSPSYV